MTVQMPEPDREHLGRSPLTAVVCQVRFEETFAVSDSRLILAIQQVLGGKEGPYPRLEQVKAGRVEVEIAPEGVAQKRSASLGTTGWRLQSEDRVWTASVMPDFLALETTEYTTWEGDFKPRLEALVDAVATHVEPAIEQRLGLRYINRIAEPGVRKPHDWRELVDASLLGLVLHERLGEAIRATQQQIELELDEAVRCTLRHGFFSDPNRDGELTYILDFDVFREEGKPFVPEEVKEAASAFNDWALRLFQQAITPGFLKTLRESEEVGRDDGSSS